MSILIIKDTMIKAILLIFGSLVSSFALANGEIGDHINDLQGHLNQYEEEVVWFLEEVNKLTNIYYNKSAETAITDVLIDN